MKLDPRLPKEGVNVTQEHPLKDVAHLLLMACLVALAFVFVAGVIVDLAVRRISTEREIELFDSLGPSLVEHLANGGDEEVERALAPLFARVVEKANAPPYPFRLRILCTDTPNALAVPGGFVGVTSGPLKRMRTENELAFVLGHELGHFAHRHHLRNMGRGVAVAFVLGALLAGAGVDLDSPAAWVFDGALKSHSRDQEIEADRLGAAVLAKLYGHTAGAGEVLDTLSDVTSEGVLDHLDFTRTHPVGTQRKAALDKLTREKGWTTEGPTEPLPVGVKEACSRK